MANTDEAISSAFNIFSSAAKVAKYSLIESNLPALSKIAAISGLSTSVFLPRTNSAKYDENFWRARISSISSSVPAFSPAFLPYTYIALLPLLLLTFSYKPLLNSTNIFCIVSSLSFPVASVSLLSPTKSLYMVSAKLVKASPC